MPPNIYLILTYEYFNQSFITRTSRLRFNGDGSPWNRRLLSNMKRLHKVHIDNHKLYRDSLRIILNQYYHAVELYSFNNSDIALAHILNNMKQRKTIDLIVIDFTKFWKNAIDFAQQIPSLENKYQNSIPVLLFTMKEKMKRQN